MRSALRVAIVLLGALFVGQGLLWIAAPARAAAGLGMPLLDGLARSTQIGDFGAFFLTAGGAILLGCRPGRSRLLRFPAALIGSAALLRTLAFLLHGAALAAAFIAIEVATSALLLLAARRLAADP